jgi:hypothetical protein
MYQLTVDAAEAVTVTDHPDRDAAHGHLLRHAVRGDYYLRTVQTGPAHSTYQLLALTEGRRGPRSAGHAVIEDLSTDEALPVDSPDQAAAAATRWITHHQPTWRHGCDTDPGTGYPLAILTAARAEARYWFAAGTLLPEAALLAAAGSIPRPSQQRLETLRHHANAHAGTDENPAAVVTGHVESATASTTVAALIWWYALLSWGASAT